MGECESGSVESGNPAPSAWRRRDWLNHGHETWRQLRYQQVTPERFRQVVAWGMVPVAMSRTGEHKAGQPPAQP